MIVIFFGAPGCGKGTQSQLLREAHGFIHISTGDALRSEIEKGTELGIKVQEDMKEGKLADEKIVSQIVANQLQNIYDNHYLLDGFPRTVSQAEFLDSKIIDSKVLVINFLINDAALIKRLSGRRTCNKCNFVTNINEATLEDIENCPKCSDGKLTQRKDDAIEVIANRLKTFHDQTYPVINYYKNKGIQVYNIDADNPVDIVTIQIIDALNLV
jgi:adenylate kinase